VRTNSIDFSDRSEESKGRRLGSLPFGMNSQVGQNSHDPLRFAQVAPFDAVNR
jgi:hypothetical protein